MLQVKNISFSYTERTVIENLTFSIVKGEHVSVIGESGCGKSTLLKLIYGLHDLDSGKILFSEKEVLGPKFNLIPGVPDMKYLAQDFGLMPYITVAENVGKFLSNTNRKAKDLRIAELLETVEMSEFANVKPQHLSGGQQQRTALAMVLAQEPELLLLDEPFSQIDVFRKNKLRRKLFSYCREKAISCIVATHDITDVLSFSDHTIVMRHGQIVGSGTPLQLYQFPSDLYIAGFFGDATIVSGHFFGIDQESIIVYPWQLETVAESHLKVKIVSNFYQGKNYLVRAEFTDGNIYFENATPISIGSSACLGLKEMPRFTGADS